MAPVNPEPYALRKEDLPELVAQHPLAWVVSVDREDVAATVIPVRPRSDGDGRLVSLVGHFARRNRHLDLLRRQPRATILTLGPNAYISPSWLEDRQQAPTWSYVSAVFVADVELFDAPDRIEPLLHDLVDAQERGRPARWSASELGARLPKLSRGIVGFEARIVHETGIGRLGQAERRDVYRDIVQGLTQSGAEQLLGWMRRYEVDEQV